ncbi:hypothetical protein V5O48_018233, partial [Marasmius crinis-equi]
MDRPISGPNADGFIYIFQIDGADFSDVTKQDLRDTTVYKVGRSCCPERREREWGRQCPSQTHTWFVPVRVEKCHDVERLVHKALEKICVERPKKKCIDCGQVHQEIFIMANGPDVVNSIMIPLIEEQNRVAQGSSGLAMPGRYKNPYQLKEGDYPQGAKKTKKALEVFLCALMRLLKVDALPPKPSDEAKEFFEEGMENIDNYLSHASDTFTLVQEEMKEATKKLKETLRKSEHLRQDVKVIDDIALRSICGGLASMGLLEFTPDLSEDASSSWNTTHRNIAIRMFQNACMSGGMRRWVPTKTWYDNDALLARFYNNYLFSYIRSKTVKEENNPGVLEQERIDSLKQKQRKRLGDARGKSARELGLNRAVQDLVEDHN